MDFRYRVIEVKEDRYEIIILDENGLGVKIIESGDAADTSWTISELRAEHALKRRNGG